MDEYIKRSDALKVIETANSMASSFLEATMKLCVTMDRIAAADVVEVVRCRDCEYGKEARVNEKGFLICPASGMEITDNDYCSYGVSKDGEGE